MKKILLLCALFGAVQLAAQTFTTYTTADGLINNTVNCLAVDDSDHLWFGTQEGISKFDGSTWTSFDVTTHPDLLNNTIKAIAVDSENNIWIGTDNGLNKFDGSNWTSYTEADGLADDRVKYIAQSPSGAIYVGNNDGLSILENGSFSNYTDEIPFGGINFITFETSGKAWLGSPLAGILIFDAGNFTTIDEDNNGLLSDKVRSISIDNNNHKWIGTADGVSVFNSQNELLTHHEAFFVLPPPDELNPIEDVLADENGRIWVAVYVDYLVTEGGIALYADQEWYNFDVDDGLAGPVVRRLAMDSQSNLWVATSTGVSRMSDLPNSTFDLSIQQAIAIAPNPSKGSFQLTVPENLVGKQYGIYNSVGMLLQKGEISHLQSSLHLKNAAKGMYFLSIDGLYTHKIMVD